MSSVRKDCEGELMLSNKCDLNKPGVKQLDHMGTCAVIANKRLYEQGKVHRFAVVNTREHWVDNFYTTHQSAISRTRTLM